MAAIWTSAAVAVQPASEREECLEWWGRKVGVFSKGDCTTLLERVINEALYDGYREEVTMSHC